MPFIETERLILRPPQIEDFEGWAEFMADDEATRFIGGTMGRAQAWRNMMVVIGSWTAIGVGFFSVIEKSSGYWIGRVGPWKPELWPGTEVGWGLLPIAHGKGYALEAAIASIDYAVDILGWRDIIHTIETGNIASEKLAQRLGSHNRNIRANMPAPFDTKSDFFIWGQSADEWRLRRKAQRQVD